MNIPLPDTRAGVRSEVLGLGFEKLDRDVFDPTKAYPFLPGTMPFETAAPVPAGATEVGLDLVFLSLGDGGVALAGGVFAGDAELHVGNLASANAAPGEPVAIPAAGDNPTPGSSG